MIAAGGLCALLAAAFPPELASQAPGPAHAPEVYRYRPTPRVPPLLESLQKQLVPGGDAFPDEKEAQEIADRLAEYGRSLKGHFGGVAGATDALLAAVCRGARLTSADEQTVDSGSQLQIRRSRSLPSELTLDRTAFKKELATVVSDFAAIDTAEFLITAIEVRRDTPASALTTVRFDLAGTSRGAGRAQRVGHWRVRWVAAGGAWKASEWSALDYVRSHATAAVFTETTDVAFGGTSSFTRQLVPSLDYWAGHLDGIFMPRGMGHHGVSVGDIDGDGLDDLYVAQPDGLPNRMFRNSGAGTFQDVTEAAGLAVLDRTSQSLFADIDNDGDQDLILLTRPGPMLFVNDGKGRFTRRAEAFQFEQPLQGSLTSAAIADYDRDGFLDIYLCAYGYFIGVSEDKAGPPSPYHDALNGSPNVLLRNDGHGRFMDVTSDVGLDENNDRFSFAAAWADYDEDGWPDLLVANDFGRKNLYRNLGPVNGRIRFTDVAREAGVEDYGAGMSAAFVDYDNDGRLDIYTGNMWTSAGQRVTAAPGFKPDASAEIRDVYRRHARGNALFRNRGDGTFEDVTLEARAEFGRWAWSSDAFDFDSDGWQDLYVANGMFTRDDGEPSVDVDSFFWRHVVAQSPLTRTPGTPYDDGWRLTNRLLVSDGAQAQHERNVLLRNDGRGGFDEVSGTSGIGLDQDGRAFGIFDYDSDGDPDVVLMAPRSSPQLRLFRNDFASGHASVALRLRGIRSNRDAIGARVTIETDRGLFTRIVTAGSGFLSQHSKELVIGLGRSRQLVQATIVWPNGTVQALPRLPLNQRTWIDEGEDAVRSAPFHATSAPVAPVRRTPARETDGGPEGPPYTGPEGPAYTAPEGPHYTAPGPGIWLYQPFPAPDFALRGFDGKEYVLAGLVGRPLVLCFWASWAPPSLAVIEELSREHESLAAAGASVLAVAVDSAADEPKVKAAAARVTVPVMMAGDDMAGAYNVLHRSLFDRRQDLGLPTTFLIDRHGDIVKVYKAPVGASQIVHDIANIDAADAARLTRAVPFPGRFLGSLGERSYFQYGLELSEQGFDTPALAAFERVVSTDPSAIVFYNLGTLYMKRGRNAEATAAFERALQVKTDYADANNSLGALLAHNGDLPGAIAQFTAALAARPQFADAMNNLGYALFQTGDAAQARELYEKALALQPEFPEALNNLGILYGTQRDLDRAIGYFQQAVSLRSTYGEAANNLALVLAARGDTARAIEVLRRLLHANPAFEMGYVTLCRIYLKAGQRQEGTEVLEQLLQRNPAHPLGLQLLEQVRAGG